MNEDLFGSIKQTITETAGAVGKKTEEFVETQKMRNKVRTLQREIRKKYADVGEIVYKRYVDGDTMDEELTGHCEVVMGLQKELAECKESMAAKQGKMYALPVESPIRKMPYSACTAVRNFRGKRKKKKRNGLPRDR